MWDTVSWYICTCVKLEIECDGQKIVYFHGIQLIIFNTYKILTLFDMLYGIRIRILLSNRGPTKGKVITVIHKQ